MYNEFKDEVIVGLPKYNVTNNADGTKSIELANTVTESGTPLNRATFANLQGDLYTEAKYNTPTYSSGNAMTLNLPLTSYETGKIVRIKSPNTFPAYPTLNINQLGAKSVNARLVAGKLYDLIYNGTSFDVNLAGENGVDKYYPITSTVETVTSNYVPTIGWSGSGMSYTVGDFALNCTNLSSGTLTDILQNNNNYVQTENTSAAVDFIITLDRPLEITKFRLYAYHTSSLSLYREISGSNNLQDWTELYYIQDTSYTDSEVTLTSTGKYKYYKLKLDHSNSGYYYRLYKFYPTEYKQSKVILNIPITDYEENMIVRIKSDANLTYPVISINGLSERRINGELASNQRYTLIYNSRSFDLLDKKEYAFTESGTYTIEDGLYYVEMCGGGGGGSYSGTGSNQYTGGPGAVAGFIQELGGNITVVIGAGGTRGRSSTSFRGGVGGNTYINGISVTASGGQAFDGHGAGGTVNSLIKPVFKIDGIEGKTGSARDIGLEHEGILYGKEGTGGSSSDVTTEGTRGVIILHKI